VLAGSEKRCRRRPPTTHNCGRSIPMAGRPATTVNSMAGGRVELRFFQISYVAIAADHEATLTDLSIAERSLTPPWHGTWMGK
jgi:hypothetical protein